MAAKQPNQVGGPLHRSILDSIITGIFGPSTDEMTPAEGAQVQHERDADAQQAYSMATSARKNPGAQFMDGPQSVGGSGDLLKLIGGVAKFFGG